MDICLFDLAGLRFERSADRTVVWVRAASGELLASADVPAEADRRRCAAAACDAALAVGTVLRYVDGAGDTAVPIALYNPYSAEVAVEPLPETRAFGDGSPLHLPGDGAVGVLQEDTLTVGGRTLPRIAMDAQACSRSLAAHPDLV